MEIKETVAAVMEGSNGAWGLLYFRILCMHWHGVLLGFKSGDLSV